MSKKGAPSQRQLRVGEELRHVLSEYLNRGELADLLLERASPTVSEVRVSGDLKQARVFISTLRDVDMEAVLEILEKAKPRLKGEISRQMRLKFMPELFFEADPVPEQADHIEDLLNRPEVRRDLDGTDGEF